MPPNLFPFALGLSPRRRVIVDRAPPADSLLDPALFAELTASLPDDDAAALLDLAARFPAAPLPPTVAFFRDLARATLAASAASPTSGASAAVNVAALLDAAPPMLGHEYLDEATLQALSARFAEALDALLLATEQTLESWLHAHNPAWAVVGRVCFHLAENRTNAERPFAFMATYSVGLASGAGAQHRPLGQALAQSAAANDREGLLRLLLPVHRAAEGCAWLRELVDSQAVFRPQAWTPAQAHRFLREVPAFEAAGLVVRVPDWWRRAAPPRAEVVVSLGKDKGGALGVAGLLSFDVGVSIDGDALSAEEWAQLRATGAGLVPLRGRWVEVDQARLEEVLAIWNQAKEEARGGVPFHKAMRLLAGAEQPSRLSGLMGDAEAGWSRVVAGPWLAEVLTRLRTPGNERGDLPGALLHATLRPYQELGVRWLGFLNQLGLGACLADDMGLGKTIQVLALLLVLKTHGRATGPHLLVAPASLLGNWRAEAARFSPSLVLRTVHSSGDGVSADVAKGADLVITTYGTLTTTEWLRERQWDTVILDEAQAIKNPGTKQTRAVTALHARVRLALSGTPVENRAGDLWSLFQFLQPGLLGSAAEFRKFVDGRETATAGWAPLRALVSPYLLRRLKTDPKVAPDLPPKTEMTAECGLSREQAALYQRTVEELASALDNADGMARRGAILATLLRFKQICNHPSHWLGDGGWELGRSGKLMRLAELVEPIVQRQEKLLVFSQFREAVVPLARVLAELFGREGMVLHGGTAIGERQALVNRFQTDDALPFAVLSLKAGGTGLNLTAATHVIHFDRWWNPAVEDQATDRAFRIGQQHPVFVHKLVCRGTVEEKVDALLAQKRGLAQELISGKDEVRLTELSNADLLRTVSLDLHRARLD